MAASPFCPRPRESLCPVYKQRNKKIEPTFEIIEYVACYLESGSSEGISSQLMLMKSFVWEKRRQIKQCDAKKPQLCAPVRIGRV